MGHEYIEQTIAIHVADGDTHVRLRLAHGVASDAPHGGFLAERAVALIDPEMVRFAVIGNEDIRPAVAVEIRTEDSKPGAGETAQSGLHCDIFEPDGECR